MLQPMFHKLVSEDLPPDSSSQQNAAIITYPYFRTWPLILDPLAMALQWLTKREKTALVINYQVHINILCGFQNALNVLPRPY